MILIFLFLVVYAKVGNEEYPAVVEELVKILNNNDTLKEEILKVMNHPFLKENGIEFRYRKKMEIEDLYEFFTGWISYQPTIDNSTYFDSEFFHYYGFAEGNRLVKTPILRNWISDFVHARGNYMDSALSKTVVSKWENDKRINMNDFVIPKGGYPSFNSFFTRSLKNGTRPIYEKSDWKYVTSPCDCRSIEFAEDIDTSSTEMRLKGMLFNTTKVLGGSKYSKYFERGKYVIFTLGVTDYHRFHTPVAGKIVEATDIFDLYFGTVIPPRSFWEDRRRTAIIIETEELGYVGYVPIGIADISSIQLSVKVGSVVDKGSELGKFAYGGSTIVIFFQEHAIDKWDFLVTEKILVGKKIAESKGLK